MKKPKLFVPSPMTETSSEPMASHVHADVLPGVVPGRTTARGGSRPPCHAGRVIVTLETERLVLRPFLADDLGALVVLQAEPTFWWFPLRRGMTEGETAEFLGWVVSVQADPGRPVFHAVVERESGALIGWAGLSVPEFLPELLPAVEVGWRRGSDFRGRGYATRRRRRRSPGGSTRWDSRRSSPSTSRTTSRRVGSWTGWDSVPRRPRSIRRGTSLCWSGD